MADYSRIVKKKASDGGCTFLRNGKGSHEIWSNPENGAVTAIPHKIKSKDMGNAILKQLGIIDKL